MEDWNLSKERIGWINHNSEQDYVYSESKVKEFIQRLKEYIVFLKDDDDAKHMNAVINHLAGSKLTGEIRR